MSWNQRTIDERARIVGGLVAHTSQIALVETCLSVAMESHGTRPDGKVHVIEGETSLGKSTAVRYFMDDLAKDLGGAFRRQVDLSAPHRSIEESDFVHVGSPEGGARPIVRIQVAPTATYNGLLADTIFSLTGRQVAVSSYKHHRLMNLLAQQINGHGTKVIIFDDAHNLARNLATEKASLAADMFKVLAKTTRVEVVLIGSNQLEGLFKHNTELAAMRDLEFEILPMDEPTTEASEYLRFLQSFEIAMPFNARCDFSSLDVARKMHAFTGGTPGQTSVVLQLATRYAIQNNLGCVDETVIGLTLRDWKKKRGKDNPFLPSNLAA